MNTATDPAALARRAIAALASGDEAEILPLIAAAADRARSDPLLWQCTGLLHRALDQHAEALPAFEQAARLAPNDFKIAHGRAQVAFEAGIHAVDLFERARALNPADGSVHLGLAAARLAASDGAAAIGELDTLLMQNPGWTDGHATLARLRAMMGDPQPAGSYVRALSAQPRDAALWQALVHTLIVAERDTEALDAIHRGRTACGDSSFFDASEAAMLSETGDVVGADRLLARLADGEDEALAVRRIRHTLRYGRLDEALTLVDRWAARPDAAQIWPYAGLAWRMAGDPRREWLEGDERLVSVIDLGERLGDPAGLATTLRALHLAVAQPLDQSVRGGTQTDGQLLQRIEPAVQALRRAIVGAVEAHVARLPPVDPTHPTLRHRRDRRIRVAGAWSVRLGSGGHHANHVHPSGWLSSALYVALPVETERGGGDAGWLTLGEPQAALGLDLPPHRTIEPKVGRLVLFPSTMWHGTRPFAAGERLTVAVDIAPPR